MQELLGAAVQELKDSMAKGTNHLTWQSGCLHQTAIQTFSVDHTRSCLSHNTHALNLTFSAIQAHPL
jgi:hypothetical protein